MFDEQLHKEYVFCSYLLHLIPPDKVQKWDLDDKVKLEYYKLQETFSGTIALDKNTGGAYEPATQKKAVPKKEQKSPIEEVIEKFNENYAGDISEADRILVGILMDKMKTSFCQQFFDIAERAGVCYEELRELFTLDPRVGSSHTFVYRDHPYWDSHCLNKDVPAIANAYQAELLLSMIEFNERRKNTVTEKGKNA